MTKQWDKRDGCWERRRSGGSVDTSVVYVKEDDRVNVDAHGEDAICRDIPARVLRDLLGDTEPAPVKKRRGPPPADGRPYWVEGFSRTDQDTVVCICIKHYEDDETQYHPKTGPVTHIGFHWPYESPEPPSEVEPEPPEDGWWLVPIAGTGPHMRSVRNGLVTDSGGIVHSWDEARTGGQALYDWVNATRFVPEER